MKKLTIQNQRRALTLLAAALLIMNGSSSPAAMEDCKSPAEVNLTARVCSETSGSGRRTSMILTTSPLKMATFPLWAPVGLTSLPEGDHGLTIQRTFDRQIEIMSGLI